MRNNIKTPMALKTTDVYVGVGDMGRAADKREESRHRACSNDRK
jgi:hypothetical protein